jgi:hypothetical protein
LIEQQNCMMAGRDRLRDFRQMERHGLGRAARKHQAGAFALGRADRSKDVSGGGSQIARRRRTGAALGPAPGDLVLLPNARLIGKPDL